MLKRRSITERFLRTAGQWAVAGILAILAYASNAQAYHPIDDATIAPCGRLESFLGSVQIFDATRTQVIDVVPGKKLQCGDWVSVEDGKAVIVHNQGFKVQVGRDSFVQILDPNSGGNPGKDHLALYRGQIDVTSPAGIEGRVATANGRAGFKGSRGFLIFDGSRYETQLIGLSGRSVLLNRDLAKNPVTVTVGRFSQVDPNENRLHPRQPRAAQLKPLTELMGQFGVVGESREKILAAAKAATVTKMPSHLASSKSVSRAPASEGFKPVKGSDLPVAESQAKAETWSVQGTGPAPQVVEKAKRTRAPASVKPRKEMDWTVAPSFAEQEKEKKKILQKLSGLTPGEDE